MLLLLFKSVCVCECVYFSPLHHLWLIIPHKSNHRTHMVASNYLSVVLCLRGKNNNEETDSTFNEIGVSIQVLVALLDPHSASRCPFLITPGAWQPAVKESETEREREWEKNNMLDMAHWNEDKMTLDQLTPQTFEQACQGQRLSLVWCLSANLVPITS